MADRKSAELFGEIFTILASETPIDHEAMVRYFWEKAAHYDFSPQQMECNEALMKLGLARVGMDLEYPGEGEVMLYRGDKGF